LTESRYLWKLSIQQLLFNPEKEQNRKNNKQNLISSGLNFEKNLSKIRPFLFIVHLAAHSNDSTPQLPTMLVSEMAKRGCRKQSAPAANLFVCHMSSDSRSMSGSAANRDTIVYGNGTAMKFNVEYKATCTMKDLGEKVSIPKANKFNPPPRLLRGPGPGNTHPRVHAAMSLPQVGHLDPYFLELMEDIKSWVSPIPLPPCNAGSDRSILFFVIKERPCPPRLSVSEPTFHFTNSGKTKVTRRTEDGPSMGPGF